MSEAGYTNAFPVSSRATNLISSQPALITPGRFGLRKEYGSNNLYDTIAPGAVVTPLSGTQVSQICGGCQLNIDCTYFAANSSVTASGKQYMLSLKETDRRPPYIVYHEYSITSISGSKSLCVTSSGGPVTIEPSVFVTVSNSMEPGLKLSAASFLASYLGFTNCLPNAEMVTSLPSLQDRNVASSTLQSSTGTGSIPTVASLTGPALAPSSTPSASRNSRTTPVKLIAGLMVLPIMAFVLILSFCLWHRRRKLKLKRNPIREVKQESNPQPFLQQKPELHSEQARHEMSAEDSRYELDEDYRRNELDAHSASNETAVGYSNQEDATAWGITASRELCGIESSQELAG